jgi:hypothetical protein
MGNLKEDGVFTRKLNAFTERDLYRPMFSVH